MSDQYFVYILTTSKNSALYIGVTNDLLRRISEHKQGLLPGFTRWYNIHKLVYFEQFTSPQAAIQREKQLKS